MVRSLNSIFLFLILVSVTVAWKLVHKIPQALDENATYQCEVQCLRDTNCAAFRLQKSNVSTNFECFFLSSMFLNISKKVSRKYPVLPSITGFKTGVKSNNQYIQHLVVDTVATDSSSMISFPQHFSRGCSYSIFLWVWLWRPRKQTSQEQYIFTTRSVFPSLDDQPTLSPAVLINVGAYPGRYFFSLVRDGSGFHSGFSPKGSEVKYHEWTHIALVVNDNILTVFLNGEYIDYVVAYSKDSLASVCPYSRFMVDTSTVDFRNNHNHTNTEFANDSDDLDFENRLTRLSQSRERFGSLMNNSILQVMGGRGVRSTAGLLQDLFIVRNKAFTAPEIKELLRLRPLRRSPTLDQLLAVYGVHSLEGLCFPSLVGDYYLSIEWGVCPSNVCGDICFDEVMSFNLLFAVLNSFPNRLSCSIE